MEHCEGVGKGSGEELGEMDGMDEIFLIHPLIHEDSDHAVSN